MNDSMTCGFFLQKAAAISAKRYHHVSTLELPVVVSSFLKESCCIPEILIALLNLSLIHPELKGEKPREK